MYRFTRWFRRRIGLRSWFIACHHQGDLFGDGSDWFPREESTGGEGGLKVGKEENRQEILEQEDEQGT